MVLGKCKSRNILNSCEILSIFITFKVNVCGFLIKESDRCPSSENVSCGWILMRMNAVLLGYVSSYLGLANLTGISLIKSCCRKNTLQKAITNGNQGITVLKQNSEKILNITLWSRWLKSFFTTTKLKANYC